MVDYTPFSPDWVSPPGATIATILEERGATPVELADWIARSPDDVEELLEGRAEITTDMARRLARVLGASEAFWTWRKSQYRADLARLHQEGLAARERQLAERDPREGHRAVGVDRTARQPGGSAAACLRFFGVPSVRAWRDVYGDALSAAYRTSPTYKSEPGAVAAWIRQGEIAAASIECGRWDPERLRREPLPWRIDAREGPAEIPPRADQTLRRLRSRGRRPARRSYAGRAGWFAFSPRRGR